MMNRRKIGSVAGCSLMPLGIVLFAIVYGALPARADEPATAPKPAAAATSTDAPVKPKLVAQTKAGAVLLRARDATVHGKKLRYDADRNTLGYWTKVDEWISWDFEIKQPETFTVTLQLSAGEESGGGDFTVEVADKKLPARVPQTGSFSRFRERVVGTVTIEKPGNYTLSIRALNKPGQSVMNLRSVSLDPPPPPKPAPTKKPPADGGQKELPKTP